MDEDCARCLGRGYEIEMRGRGAYKVKCPRCNGTREEPPPPRATGEKEE